MEMTALFIGNVFKTKQNKSIKKKEKRKSGFFWESGQIWK